MTSVVTGVSAPQPTTPKRVGLLPLEFADCLLDSPYFRENLRAHEKQLDQTSADIKGIIKDVQDVVEAARTLSKAKRTLASSLANFQFDCLGTVLTDDEIIIANSLKEFAKFLCEVEEEMDRMLDNAHDKFATPLVNFRKQQIGKVKTTKKDFDKATSRFCTAQDNYIKSKKEESLAEAAEGVRHEQKALRSASLEYVYLMHVVQERKKFDFVETLWSFMHSWSNYYRFGHERTQVSAPYMNDLKARVQRCRNNFVSTIESYDSLKDSWLHDFSQDPGAFNPMYTRQGYLYVQTKNKSVPFNVQLGSQWTKHYCQYQAKSKTLSMIPYTQLNGKITTSETVRVTSCVCKSEDSSEKFRFVVHGDELTQGIPVTYTFQAMSEFERKHWVESLGGTWPAVNTLQKLRADSVEDNLNSMAFTFLKDCLHELESRGLTDQGLYRVGGVVSKVKKLLNEGLLGSADNKPFDLSDPKQWESKTIASAVKQYFRDLSKPLMTHTLYGSFVEAVKSDSEVARLSELSAVMTRMPVANREMLKVLIRHLNKVAAKHDTNLMTAANLGVVFGPTLLRPREETVASIMDIKFCNEVVEILIDNCDTFFPAHEQSDSSPEISLGGSRKHKSKAPPVPKVDEEVENEDEASSPVEPRPLRYHGLQQQLPHQHHGHLHHGHQDHQQQQQHQREKRGSSTPKRTHSFSSFSQLSTNSLPDIKELHPSTTVLTINGNRHHYHHHHHGHTGGHGGHQRGHQDTPDSVAPIGPPSKSSQSKQVLKIHSPVKQPTMRPLFKSTSKDADLMASLEMMNNLAADLPHSNNNNGSHHQNSNSGGGGGSTALKRSMTVQHRRPQASTTMVKTPTSDETKKPPLPKLSLGNSPVIASHSSHFSDTSSTGSSTTGSGSSNIMPNTYKQVLASRMHSSPPSSCSAPVTSGSSPNIPLHYPASPRPNRPKELFVRQITLPMEPKAYEETPIVPSPSLASPLKTPTSSRGTTEAGGSKGSEGGSTTGSNNNRGQVPPPIPARRYPRGVYHTISSSNNTDESECDQRRGSESGGGGGGGNGSYQRSTVSADSGILTSPSPPNDSAVSPPILHKPSIISRSSNGNDGPSIPKPPDQFADYKQEKTSKKSSTSDQDTVSITSSSESDTTSGSRYDNVPQTSAKKTSANQIPPKKSSANQIRHSFGSNPSIGGSGGGRRCSNDTISNSSKTSTLVAAAAEIAAQRIDDIRNNFKVDNKSVENNKSSSLSLMIPPPASPTREMSTQTQILDGGEDGDDEDEASDTSSDILVLDSSSSDTATGLAHGLVGHRGRHYQEHDLDEELDDDDDDDEPEDELVPDDLNEDCGSKNNDEIEISDHFCRRNNSRRHYNNHHHHNNSSRHSGPYDNFVLPGAVLPPPSSVSSSVETPLSSASSPSPPALSPNGNAMGRNNGVGCGSSSGGNSVVVGRKGLGGLPVKGHHHNIIGTASDNTNTTTPASEKLEPASIKRLLAAGPTSNV